MNALWSLRGTGLFNALLLITVHTNTRAAEEKARLGEQRERAREEREKAREAKQIKFEEFVKAREIEREEKARQEPNHVSQPSGSNNLYSSELRRVREEKARLNEQRETARKEREKAKEAKCIARGERVKAQEIAREKRVGAQAAQENPREKRVKTKSAKEIEELGQIFTENRTDWLSQRACQSTPAEKYRLLHKLLPPDLSQELDEFFGMPYPPAEQGTLIVGLDGTPILSTDDAGPWPFRQGKDSFALRVQFRYTIDLLSRI